MVFRVGLDFKSTEVKLLWQTSCCCLPSTLLWKEPWDEVEMPCRKGKSGPSFENYQECSVGRFSMVSTRWQRGTGCSESGKTQRWVGGSQKGLWEQRTLQGLKGTCKATSWNQICRLEPASTDTAGRRAGADKSLYLLLICSECLLFKTLSILLLILI